MERLVLGVLLVLATVAPAGALAQTPEPPAEVSPRVGYVGTLPDPAAVSARFRGQLMYLSTLKGLSIYDISRPDSPALLGRLALPHFQNEDVDLALERDILLISEDPNEGQGVLHVVDISDPRSPQRISSLNTGFLDGSVDIIYNFFLRSLPEELGLPPFPVDNPIKAGNGHTASCVQPRCDFALLAGNLQGLHVVDLRDPASPAFMKRVPVEEAAMGIATHDVQFDTQPDGTQLAWVSGAGGVAAYKVSDIVDPAIPDPEPVLRTDPAQSSSDYARDLGTDVDPETGEETGKRLNDFVHHNSLRLRNSSLASPPDGESAQARSGFLLVTEEDYTRANCDNAGSFQTWGLAESGLFRNLDEWRVEDHGGTDTTGSAMCSAHYFDEHTGLVAQGWYEEGTRFFDVSEPTDIRQVGYWIPRGALAWGAYFAPTDPTGQIVYSLDFSRGVDVLRIDRPSGSSEYVQSPDPPNRDPAPEKPRDEPGPFESPGTADEAPPALTTPRGYGPLPTLDRRARLAVRVRGPRRLRPRRSATYRITVTNEGRAATRATVRLRLPTGVRRVRGGTASRSGRTVTFSARSLKPGSSRTFRLVVRARRALRRVSFGDPVARPSAGDNRRMPTVVAPRRRRESSTVTYESRFGAVCRIVLSAS